MPGETAARRRGHLKSRKVDWLEQIRSCNDMTTEGENLKIVAICNAREQGITWALIGKALGVTGQAAGQRYGRYVNV